MIATFPHPRQPISAFLESAGTSNVIGYEGSCFLADLDQKAPPYSRNGFLLVELITDGGALPTANFDNVIFHSRQHVVAIAVVSSVLAIQSNPGQPGCYRTLVACEPMSTIANVRTPEGFENFMEAELDHAWGRIDKNLCKPNSRAVMPMGACMRNQQLARELLLETFADAALCAC